MNNKNEKKIGFKLLAIRPLLGCDSNFRKNLEEGAIYKFYQDYKFFDKTNKEILFNEGNLSEDICYITPPKEICDLYSTEKLNINISAVVGKNGSGKSSLLEMYYCFCYIANNLHSKSYLRKEVTDGFKAELYYLFDNDLFQLIFNPSKIEIKKSLKSASNNKDERKFESWKGIDTSTILNHFSYSVAINYSLYGLSTTNKSWLEALFDKNDGYQSPIVINPYRKDGININVKSEHHLAQSRTLLNVAYSKSAEILKNKFIQEITFEFNPLKTMELFNFSFARIIEEFDKNYAASSFDLFLKFYEKITEETFAYDSNFETLLKTELNKSNFENEYTFSNDAETDYQTLKVQLVKYVIYKIFKLTHQDDELQEEYAVRIQLNQQDSLLDSIPGLDPTKVNDLLNRLSELNSHLTLKLRQICFALKNNTFDKQIQIIENSEKATHLLYKVSFGFQDFIKLFEINSKNHKVIDFDFLNLIPAAFANVGLQIKHGESSNTSPMYELSSGEQQMIFTLNSIYYHLYNINSVSESTEKIKYKDVNLILDEIELYFHPDFQRRFISELLEGFKLFKIDKIESVNILFSTHSPFILSDIPSSNILRLKMNDNGKAIPSKDNNETFGANIHDLLANDFFLQDGFMGEFAKNKINEIVDDLNDSIKKKKDISKERFQEIEKIINLVGEPMLKNSLNGLFIDANPKRKIDFLQKQMDQLKKLKSRNNDSN